MYLASVRRTERARRPDLCGGPVPRAEWAREGVLPQWRGHPGRAGEVWSNWLEGRRGGVKQELFYKVLWSLPLRTESEGNSERASALSVWPAGVPSTDSTLCC